MILDFTLVHQVTVKTYQGTGANAVRRVADPVPVGCYVMDVTEIVKNGEGQEVVSTAKINAPLSASPTVPSVAGQFTPGSEVTLPSGRVATVIKAARHDSGALNLGLNHATIWLT